MHDAWCLYGVSARCSLFSEPVHDDDVQEDGAQAGLVTRSETQTVEVQLMRPMSSHDPILESAWSTKEDTDVFPVVESSPGPQSVEPRAENGNLRAV